VRASFVLLLEQQSGKTLEGALHLADERESSGAIRSRGNDVAIESWCLLVTYRFSTTLPPLLELSQWGFKGLSYDK
jgi:hypothetical protein